MRNNNQKGFTLVELLIVTAIIIVLAVVVYFVLDPSTRFQDMRDAKRFSDVAELLHAVKVEQVEGGETYQSKIASLVPGEVYMIGTGTGGCDAVCDATVTSPTHCVDLSGLVATGRLEEVPVSPNANGSWSELLTGYVLSTSTTGTITVQACESENTTAISLTR